MQFRTGGQSAEMIHKPWFNWIMMGSLGVISAVGFIYLQFELPNMEPAKAKVMGMMSSMTGGMALIGLLGVVIEPVKTVVFDRSKGHFVFRKDYVFGKFGRQHPLSDIAGLKIKRVAGNGPEAYWVTLKLKNGKKKKFAPHAFKPEDAKLIKAIVQGSLRGAPAPTTPTATSRRQVSQRRGFGRAA